MTDEPCLFFVVDFLLAFMFKTLLQYLVENLSNATTHCMHRRDTEESTCLLRHVMTDKSGLWRHEVTFCS